MTSYRRTPRGAFNLQRTNAHRRGIKWDLTFEQWCAVWDDSGKWSQRGRRSGEYCMCRHHDAGPYSAGNVYIGLSTVNASEGTLGKKRTPEQNALRSRFMQHNTNSVGRRWMNDGMFRAKTVSAENIPSAIANGWQFGRTWK